MPRPPIYETSATRLTFHFGWSSPWEDRFGAAHGPQFVIQNIYSAEHDLLESHRMLFSTLTPGARCSFLLASL